MRVAIWSPSIVVAIVAGCGSSATNPTKPDAPPADLASDRPAAQPDNAAPDRASDPVAAAELVPAPEVASPKDLAPVADAPPTPDLPRADLLSPTEAGNADANPRLDLASGPDTTAKLDLVRAPEVAPAEVAPTDGATPIDVAQREVGTDGAPTVGRTLGGCPMLPANHIFNTPIDTLPVHASSAAFMATIGNRNIHLDLGTTTDMASDTYYGIPFNDGVQSPLVWTRVSYSSTDTADMTWDPLPETDCVDQSSGAAHTIVSPCLASKAPKPWLPIPAAPLVEGGIVTDPSQPYGDHHMLIIDPSVCRLWELYHCYPNPSGGWDIFGSSTWDLNSNALRPADWTSADAAGFPILPLLLLAKEASSGEIKHALRFTISSSSIRNAYVWPARHLTSNGTMSVSLPPMGQLFRIKASYQIPSSYNTQSKAILQALKTYGMYIADGGSNLYVQGDPSADWQDNTFSQVQSVGSSVFEAVDLAPIMGRAGFDPDSAAVPPP